MIRSPNVVYFHLELLLLTLPIWILAIVLREKLTLFSQYNVSTSSVATLAAILKGDWSQGNSCA